MNQSESFAFSGFISGLWKYLRMVIALCGGLVLTPKLSVGGRLWSSPGLNRALAWLRICLAGLRTVCFPKVSLKALGESLPDLQGTIRRQGLFGRGIVPLWRALEFQRQTHSL